MNSFWKSILVIVLVPLVTWLVGVILEAGRQSARALVARHGRYKAVRDEVREDLRAYWLAEETTRVRAELRDKLLGDTTEAVRAELTAELRETLYPEVCAAIRAEIEASIKELDPNAVKQVLAYSQEEIDIAFAVVEVCNQIQRLPTTDRWRNSAAFIAAEAVEGAPGMPQKLGFDPHDIAPAGTPQGLIRNGRR